MKDRLLRLVAGHPRLLLAIVLALTLGAVSGLFDWRTGDFRAHVQTDVHAILPSSGPEREAYERFLERFGSDDDVFVALVVDDVFTPENLARLRRMTEGLAALSGVERVTSLANAPGVQFEGGRVSVRPLLDGAPDRAGADLAALRAAVLASPLHSGTLVSADGRAAVLVVRPEAMTEREFLARDLDRAIEQVARRDADGAEVLVAGAPVVRAVTARMLIRDLSLAAPGTFLFMALVAALTFRTLRGVLLPTLSIALAQIWTVGLLSWSGRSLNLVTCIVPPLINTVGFAYAIHVVAEHEAVVRERRGAAGSEAVEAALRRVGFPVFLCALTTALGCLSLCTNPLPIIREFGVVCAVGVAAALLASMTVAPALLALLPPHAGAAEDAGNRGLERAAVRLARFDVRHRYAIVAATAAIAALCAAAIPRIEVSTSLVSNFRAGSEQRRTMDAFDRLTAGSMNLRVVVEADARDAFKEPENLQALEGLQRWLESQAEIGDTTSIADHVRSVHRAFRGGAEEALVVPDSRRLVAQYLFFLWSDSLGELVDSRFSAAAVVVQAPYLDSGKLSELLSRIEGRLRSLPAPLRGHVTGDTALVVRSIDEIAVGQAISLATASILIVAILVLYFRSVRLALLALVPNVLPVLVFFGALGVLGIPLNITTSLIATIVLGVAVDDTLHYLVRYEWITRAFRDAERGAVEALRIVARPVSSTNLALILGFLVLLVSELRHQVDFGMLAAGTLAFGWLMDFTLTPALAYLLGVPEGDRWPAEALAGQAEP